METEPNVDLLMPFSVLLFDIPLAEDDINESLENPVISTTSSQLPNPNSSGNPIDNDESETRVKVEDTLHKLAVSETVVIQLHAGMGINWMEFSHTIVIDGIKMAKLCALAW